jgi:hypothetical protein
MNPGRLLALAFLALLLTVPVTQVITDESGQRASVWRRLISERPTAASLKAFEDALADRSPVLTALRPHSQRWQFHLLGEGGRQVLRGRDGWLFFRPGITAAVERGAPSEALSAILDYHARLAARGIDLLVVPVPNKEQVHPEKVIGGYPAPRRWSETAVLIDQLRVAGIACVDLQEAFAIASATNAAPLYLAQDTHWTPAGLSVAAEAVATAIRQRTDLPATTRFAVEPAPMRRHGDLLAMLRVPALLRDIAPESVATERVLDESGRPFRGTPGAGVLLMGDSFLRIFESDAPGSAGFPSHLARALGRPLTVLVADGGASTLVRQELFRRPDALRGQRLVVWEFVERDLRLGAEGWAHVPLPPE